MKLLKARIHNFRGIIDQSVSFFDYTLLVGANNSGKSTVMDAIRVFYEKDRKFNKINDFPKLGSEDEDSWIELSFSVTDAERESLAAEYQSANNILHLRKYFLSTEPTWSAGTIYGRLTDGSLSEKSFYGAKNVQSGKIGEIIFVPAVSKVDEHTKLTGPSALRDLVSGIMSDVVEESEAYQVLNESVRAFASGVKEMKTTDEHSLAGFESDLNDLLAPWHTKFNLNLGTPSTADIVKSMVDWSVTEEQCGTPQDISYFGSGFQRHFIYSLIRLAAKYMPIRISKKTKDFTPKMNLILFEEPEAFLHPPQQEELARNLVKMTQAEDWQVVCSTHSANFVSRNIERIPSIVRLRRTNGIVSIYQINEQSWDAVVNSNQVITNIAESYPKLKQRLQEADTTVEMEAVRYALWLNPDRASMFFANHVLLVEGPSETALINRLLDDGRVELPPGVYVLDCLGKFNIHRFMNLLNALGVTHSVLHDQDGDTGWHCDINRLISDSRGEHTVGISCMPDDLEIFLGIPPSGSPHLGGCFSRKLKETFKIILLALIAQQQELRND
jgi:hypothetical protein